MNTQKPENKSGQPELPVRLGHYEIIEKIGQGGMAVVYKGLQPSLNRQVAIKILPPQFVSTPELVGRFDREASIVSQLNHSNIVQVIDRGKEGEIVYIVMEYVEGEGLDSLIKNEPLDTPTVVAYAMEICDALAYAHKAGVVHRDLKPSNILIDRRSGRVKIADFGIAQIEGSDGLVATLTRDNASIGTMNYMSPEQRLDSHSVNHLTDIYAFGVILYEMLIGKPPMGHFKLPSVVRPDIPLGFDNIVRKCLCESCADRYQSATDIRHDLARLAGRHHKVEEVGGGLLSLQRLNKRQRWGALAGGVGVVLALAAIGGIMATCERPEKPRPLLPAASVGTNTVTQLDADIQAKMARAEGLIAGGEMQQAVDLLVDLLRAWPEAPQAPDIQFAVASTYYAMGKKEKCKLEYHRLERQYPDSSRIPDAILGRCRAEWDTAPRKGLLLRVARDADLQKRLIEELQGLVLRVQTSRVPVAVEALALIAEIAEPPEMEDYTLAASSLMRLYELDPGQGAGPLHRAAEMHDEKLNDRRQAIAVYRKLLKGFPGYSRADAVRARIGELELILKEAEITARELTQQSDVSSDENASN